MNQTHRGTTAAAKQALGSYGEQVAARYLTERGMSLVDQNWRSHAAGASGELDLVLLEHETAVFVEVKTRSSAACGSPHEAIDEVKLQRLKRLAERWLVEHGWEGRAMRIDLVAVLRPRRGPAVVDHVRGIA